MTKINLITSDQLLSPSSNPVLASGDEKTVLLQVELDSAWDGLTMSAVFHTSENATVYEVLLKSGECVVPWEVLTKECKLYIGIRGVDVVKGFVKTSSLVKYKIVAGAQAGKETKDPTPSVYQEILAEQNEFIEEINQSIEVFKGETNQQINQFSDEIDELKENCGDLSRTDVVDNLLSDATDLPLSANQGNRIYNMLGEQLAYYKSSSTTSFRACHNDSAQSLSGFLDAKVHNVISSFADKKIHQIVDYNGGPYFFVNLSKYSNSYYCGTIHNYDTNQGCMYSFFSYCFGTFVIYSPRIISYGK